MDWKKCIICGGGGELKCPAKSLEGNAEEVYTSFIEAAKEFKVLGKLPGPLVISINDYQPGDLVQTQAKWHKSCRLKHAISKLNIAKKRQADQMDQSEKSHPVGRKIPIWRLALKFKEFAYLFIISSYINLVSYPTQTGSDFLVLQTSTL